ncbi:MAG: membrane protein insertion efficiency factor YidD [bacterium]
MMATMRWLFIALIRVYQVVISPLLPPSCRFVPSCSAFGIEAFQVHGAWRGFFLTSRRIGRCGPWCAGGHDPVPPVGGVTLFGGRRPPPG